MDDMIRHPAMREIADEEWERRVGLCAERSGWDEPTLWRFIEDCIEDRYTIGPNGEPIILDADVALAFFQHEAGREGNS